VLAAGCAHGQDARRDAEKRIAQREAGGNGIRVSELKIYDDALLQQMLNAAEAKLAGMTGLDASAVKAGNLAGASMSTAGVAVNVQAGVKPTAAPAVTAPVPTPAMPGSFSVAGSDMLNEQLQLTSEIANLRLLLEGSLTDRTIAGSQMVKPRTTVGFPITIEPDQRHRNAVAVVEVEVTKNHDLSPGAVEKPVVTALLPKEKTYNVASITDKSGAVGAGVVAGVAGGGGAFAWGHKTYYYVQDQDTLAVSFPPEDPGKAGFQWQFRPVLGREFVKAGEKQTFVQLAFPSEWSADYYGTISVRTYWRKYDRKKGLLKEVLPGSLDEHAISSWKIPPYQLAQAPKNFDGDSLEDLGGGQMLVKLYGKFLTGTYVRIGKDLPALTFEPYGIRFTAAIADLATKDVKLVARDGSELPLQIGRDAADPVKCAALADGGDNPWIVDAKVTTVDEANSLLTVKLCDEGLNDGDPPLLMVIGPKAFGYSDLPVRRTGAMLSAAVPTALLLENPVVTVRPLFPPENAEARYRLPQYTASSQAERVVLLRQDKTSAMFLLYGNRLKEATLLSPKEAMLETVGPAEDRDTLRAFQLTAEQWKANRQILIQRKDERPLAVNLPAMETKDDKEAPSAPAPPKERERVTVGANEAVIEGDSLKDLDHITFRGKAVAFEWIEKGKSLRVLNLRELGVTAAASTEPLQLVYKPGTVTVNLDVVTGKVETVAR
jgi:hypothetical protein